MRTPIPVSFTFRWPCLSDIFSSFVTWSVRSCDPCCGFRFSVKILKVLGEGGFSFVYLCQDEASGVSLAFTLQIRFMPVVLTMIL